MMKITVLILTTLVVLTWTSPLPTQDEAFEKILLDSVDKAQSFDEISDKVDATVMNAKKSDDVQDAYSDFVEKVRKFLDEKYPGLEDQIKQKVLLLAGKYKNVRELVTQGFMNLIFAGRQIKSIILRMVNDVNNELNGNAPMDEIEGDKVGFLDLKNKIKQQIKERYSKYAEKLKQKLLAIVDKAKNLKEIFEKPKGMMGSMDEKDEMEVRSSELLFG